MTMLDALRTIQANPALWARPVEYRGEQVAYKAQRLDLGERTRVRCIMQGHVSLSHAAMPTIETMLAEWETVTPDEVNEGR